MTMKHPVRQQYNQYKQCFFFSTGGRSHWNCGSWRHSRRMYGSHLLPGRFWPVLYVDRIYKGAEVPQVLLD